MIPIPYGPYPYTVLFFRLQMPLLPSPATVRFQLHAVCSPAWHLRNSAILRLTAPYACSIDIRHTIRLRFETLIYALLPVGLLFHSSLYVFLSLHTRSFVSVYCFSLYGIFHFFIVRNIPLSFLRLRNFPLCSISFVYKRETNLHVNKKIKKNKNTFAFAYPVDLSTPPCSTNI